MIQSVFLTPKEAADYLRISASTLAKLRVYGNGPSFCRFAGKAIRYQRADLDAYMASRKVTSTAQYKVISKPVLRRPFGRSGEK